MISTAPRSSGLGILVVGALLAGLAAVFMAAVPDVPLHAPPLPVPEDIAVTEHLSKHVGEELDGFKIYDMLRNNECTQVGKFCRAGKELYICVAPSGLTGGAFFEGNLLVTGYGSRWSYWARKIVKESWMECR